MSAVPKFDASKEKLIKDFKTVVADAEELLRATANETGDRVVAARARVEESIKETRQKISEAEEGMMEKAKAAAKETDKMVRANPWQAIGIAAGVGFLLGLMNKRH